VSTPFPLTLSVINVPIGFGKDRLSMGLQVIGKHHADFSLLQVAYAYEQSSWVRNNLPPLLQA